MGQRFNYNSYSIVLAERKHTKKANRPELPSEKIMIYCQNIEKEG